MFRGMSKVTSWSLRGAGFRNTGATANSLGLIIRVVVQPFLSGLRISHVLYARN